MIKGLPRLPGLQGLNRRVEGSGSGGLDAALVSHQFHRLDVADTLSRIPQRVLYVPDAVEPQVAVNMTMPEHLDDDGVAKIIFEQLLV
jgi:hypothetical protein